MARELVAMAVLLVFGAVAMAEQPARGEVPDLGLILNDDAYSAFAKPTLAESVAHLQGTVDGFAKSGIKTLTYSVGEGSEILVYPTKVASTWGWRTTKVDDDPRYAERIRRNREAIAQGGDAIRVAAERAKGHGMYFIPSLRMNDSHFMSDPEGSPFTGRFWMEHQHLTIEASGESPLSRESYGKLFDYSHAEVRQYRIGTIFEAIDRYADVIDGFELDFNRVQVFFPRGQAASKAHLITDLVRQVRAKLDALEAKNGRPYYLIARVAPSLASCDWAGLDVRTWMRERLVDVVSPSQLMTMGYDMPVDAFVAAAEGTGCKVYASILPRTVWRWPLRLDEADVGKPARAASQEQLRAAAANMWHLGADGIYLYNYRNGMLDGAVQDIASPDKLAGTDKCFTVTKNYYLDAEDTFEHRKQLPAPFENGRTAAVKLLVADDLASPPPDRAIEHCLLRLGLRGFGGFQGEGAGASLRVLVNDQPIYEGPLAVVLRVLPPEKLALSKAPDLAQQLVHLRIDKANRFTQGWNTVSIETRGVAPSGEIMLTDVELVVEYAD